MAAPSGTVWGSIVGSYGKIGIYTSVSSTATATTITTQIWFWSKYSVSDSSNTLYYDFSSSSSSATTSKGSKSISTSVNSGSGWSTSNQVKLYEYTHAAISRGTSAGTRYLYAKLANVDAVGGTMYASTTVTIPALASYKITYNANGGTGAPSAGTKYYGKSYTISTTKPTRTGYTFLGWATSSSATSANSAYDPGDTYTGNAALTLYAVWKINSYKITYNANGGTGAPSAGTKYYGKSYTISTTKPTRTGYTFLGWATSSSATSANSAYDPGDTYTGNAALTLYAVWQVSYTKPRITKASASRCNSSGTLDDEGTSALVSFTWATDKTATQYKLIVVDSSGSSVYTETVTISGTSGTVKKTVTGYTFDANKTYSIVIVVIDGGGNTTKTVTLSGTKFLIDFKSGGSGVAIGKPAETASLFDVGYNALFRSKVESTYGTSPQFLITNSSGTNTAYQANRTDTSVNTWFGIGAGGVNHGIYSGSISNWVLYNNKTNTYLNAASGGSVVCNNNFTLGGVSHTGKNKVLWSGAYYMNANQTATLSAAVSAQPHGIVLIWSWYDTDNSAADNSAFNNIFIPKQFVASQAGKGVAMFLISGTLGTAASKYVYISDTKLTGNANNNTASAAKSCGITSSPTKFVLRYVIGV